MKTLHSYIAGRYSLIFWITLVVFTFVMSVGVVFTISDLLAQGADGTVILKMFQYQVPQTLTLAIPISVLCGVLLLFAQMSTDGEVSAMKACGISLWRIMATPLVFGVFAALACLYIQNSLAPRFHYERKVLERELKSSDMLKMLDEGQWWHVNETTRVNCQRFVANILYDVEIITVSATTHRQEQACHAERIVHASVVTNGAAVAPHLIGVSNREREEYAKSMRLEEFVKLDGYDVSIDPLEIGTPGSANFEHYRWWVPVARTRGRPYSAKTKDMPALKLWSLVQNPEPDLVAKGPDAIAEKRSERLVAIHKRLSLSAACVAFVFIGVPFGIRSHRRESSVGIAISLLLVLVFYIFIILADAVHEDFGHAWMLCWLPVALALGIGTRLINRLN